MRRTITVLLMLTACEGTDNDALTGANELPAVVRDTMGNEFSTACTNGEVDCHLTPLDLTATPVCNSGLDYYDFNASDGVFRICYFVHDADSGSSVFDSGDCRPIGCEGNGPCLGGYCRNGVCQYGGAAPSLDDAIALCMADVPWPDTCERIVPYELLMTRILPIVKRCEDTPYDCEVPMECPQR
jgi:hypothetical protein